jgi:hypothetical protein
MFLWKTARDTRLCPTDGVLKMMRQWFPLTRTRSALAGLWRARYKSCEYRWKARLFG